MLNNSTVMQKVLRNVVIITAIYYNLNTRSIMCKIPIWFGRYKNWMSARQSDATAKISETFV